MGERDWDRELAEIVSRPDQASEGATSDVGGAISGAAIDLRDGIGAPGSDELAAWVERLGASLLRLVDRRLTGLGDDIAAEITRLDSRVDVLIEVVEALSEQVAALNRRLDRRRSQPGARG